MVTDAIRVRFEDALADAQPFEGLHALAKALKAEGVGQVTIYHLFAEYQAKIDADDRRYDAIVDNMDLIWGGPWAKGGALFDKEMTSEDIA